MKQLPQKEQEAPKQLKVEELKNWMLVKPIKANISKTQRGYRGLSLGQNTNRLANEDVVVIYSSDPFYGSKDVRYIVWYAPAEATSYNGRATYLHKDDVLFEELEDGERHAKKALKIMASLPKLPGMQVGADPEIFLKSNKNHHLIPAFMALPDKAAIKSEESGYWDGFQAEFNTKPGSCLAYHIDSLQRGLKNTLNSAKVALKREDVAFSTKTVVNLSKASVAAAKKEHMQFGCTPSLNAYNEELAIPPGEVVPFRMSGGHVHLGILKKAGEGNQDYKERLARYVKVLDAVLGVAGVALFAKYDDPRRRFLYGRAGEYRTPPHGLEYRVLSNAWLIHPVAAHLVFEIARKAVNMAECGLFEAGWDTTEQETRDVINNCDVKKAQEIMERNKEVMVALLHSIRPVHLPTPKGNMAAGEILFRIILKGFHTVIDQKKTLEENWNIGTKQEWRGHSEGENKNITRALPTIANGQLI